MAERLFRAGASSSKDEPLWRYVDPQGEVHGPFIAKQMLVWNAKSYFHPDILMLGCGRKVAASEVSDRSAFRPFCDLLGEAREALRKEGGGQE